MAHPIRILTVCLGNICRSPSAEIVLAAKLPGAELDSAGTSDWHIGDPPYGPMIEAAAAKGYDLTKLQARQVRREDFYEFDLILAMDGDNLANLQAQAPADATAKLALFLDPLGGGNVPDPYYTRDFDGVLELIERAAEAWTSQPQISSATPIKD